ncbi:hypothetical protein [Xenorhabdus bovienii]|uniref:hypothetical protein n=1 Tax=Xenorhabdus bovienii TaxID=40576 RepID=UPI003DA2DD61
MSPNISIAFEGVPFSGKTTMLKALYQRGDTGYSYVPETICDVVNDESALLNDYYKHCAAQYARQKGYDCFLDRSPLSTWVIDKILTRQVFCADFLSSIDAIVLFVDCQRRYQLMVNTAFAVSTSPWMKDKNKHAISVLYKKIAEAGYFHHLPVYTFSSNLLENEDMTRLIQLILTIRNDING